MRNKSVLAAAVLIASSLLGCESNVMMKSEQPAAGFVVPESRALCTAMMIPHNATFTDDAYAMPGATGGEHRQLLAASLTELSMVLKLANGSDESPEFMNRMAVIDAAQRAAANPTVPRGRMEAVENQSLLATSQALEEITALYLFNDDQLPAFLDAVNVTIARALHSEGPLHDQDAATAFQAVAEATSRMSADMTDRFGTGASPEETPAPPPVAPAATSPATMPVSP